MRKGSKTSRFFVALGAALLAAGCAPELGDSCDVSTDCSVQQDRDCDTSAPGGYCTIQDCVEGACDGEGYCVRFEPDQLRLSSSWCMAKCGRGCRSNYRCINVDELNAERCGIVGLAQDADVVEEYRRLAELPEDERCADSELTEDGRCPWERLQLCLQTMPRAAEMLDDDRNASFCGQKRERETEEEAASSGQDTQSTEADSEG